MAEVLLLGMGPTALSALESLAARLQVVGVVRPLASNASAHDPVAALARQLGIPIHPDVRPAAVAALIERLAPDCVVVSSFDRILKPDVLRLCPFINVHYSPLPAYRGRANVNWAVINDEPNAAISIHAIVPGLDSGNVLFQRDVPIGPRTTVYDLYTKLNEIQRVFLATTLLDHLAGATGAPQDEARASYGCSRRPEDGAIDWSASTRAIDGLVRGLVAPFPGAFTYHQGVRLIVWEAEPLADPPRYVGRVPGRVVAVSKATGTVDVLTGDGIIRIINVQRPGAAPTAAAKVVTSVRETLGLRTAELLERIEVLERGLLMLLAEREPSLMFEEAP